MIRSLTPWLLPLMGLAASSVQAHQVWLEHSSGQARLHFGEFNENLRETSPGSLDKFLAIPTLEQRQGEATQSLQGQRGKDAFSYTTTGQPDTLVAQTSYPLIDRSKRNQPTLLWRPAARWVASTVQPIQPTAPLDLVPTGKPGQFKVVFQGAPLAKAKVQMAAPSGWVREAETHDDGTVQFTLPWKGQYVAEVKHTDKTPGEVRGEKYGEAGYLMTLSFVQLQGLESPALPEPPKTR